MMDGMRSTDDLLEGLNPEQRRGVSFGQGPLLIIAGAGTGKTKVITHRIAYLIATKAARPDEILAVTFTEKAANEMEERVDLLIPYGYSFVEISTFNAFGERVLRQHAHELGMYLDFRLLDEVEQALFFREHLFRLPLKHYRPLSSPTRHVQEILGVMKKLKQEDVDPDDYLRYARGLKLHAQDEAGKESARKHQELALVYKSYQRLLRRHGMIDFEDQVTLAVELFRSRPSVLKEYQERYKYILVDEFQDTNHIQFELLKLLSAKHNNITVVGDDDQSIFRFRGASLSNILSFGRIYPRAERVVINTNYRSSQPILDAAYRLIRHNDPDRLEVQAKIDKSLRSVTAGKGKSIHMLQFDTLSHESDRVVDIIREQVLAGRRFRDIAILVRTNADADPFLRAMNMREIPFRFSGSRGLYAQSEIKILTAFIRAVCDFDDSRSLYHLALSEIYRMSAYDLTALSNYAHKKNLTLHLVFRAVSRGQSPVAISDGAQEAVERIFRDLMSFVDLAARQNAGQVIYAFLHQTGYLKNLAQERTAQAELRIKNIRIFFDKVKRLSEVAEDDSLFTFAGHLELLQQVGDDPASAEAELEEDAVNVLTVHKAKGLEFPVVFMVGLIADRYPGMVRRDKIPFPEEILKDPLDGTSRDSDSLRNVFVQEERRLFYVGMTRAKQILYLSWARDYGLKRLKKVSPFVLEALDVVRIPDEIQQASPIKAIESFSPPSFDAGPQKTPKEAPGGKGTSHATSLSLSFFQVDDYLTCPLKYRYRHVVRIPVLPHYNLVYGRVLHAAIHFYLQQKMDQSNPPLNKVLAQFRRRWINEGFLSREHEEMKKKAGERALRRFVRREQKSPLAPEWLEKPFKWQDADLRFSGRWDRIDHLSEGWVITDFKAAEVKNQEEADRRARHSLQLDIYALSFQKTRGATPTEMRLHFLESDILGRAQKGDKEIQRALEKIAEAEHGIRNLDFSARPDWHNCHQCDFKTICPSSYAY
jgi:DNA helicase-2/ATP-dependent DNA helicase PcrA